MTEQALLFNRYFETTDDFILVGIAKKKDREEKEVPATYFENRIASDKTLPNHETEQHLN